MRQFVYKVYYVRYQVPFYFWQIKIVLKHHKLQECYDQDCSLNSAAIFDVIKILQGLCLQVQDNHLTKLFNKNDSPIRKQLNQLLHAQSEL